MVRRGARRTKEMNDGFDESACLENPCKTDLILLKKDGLFLLFHITKTHFRISEALPI